MPETPLPSREGVAIDLALAEVDLSDAPLRDILTIAGEWASGRLVDREDIDYEAAKVVLAEAVRYIPASYDTTDDWVDAVFVAALEHPDE